MSFLNGRFFENLGRLPLWRCISSRFHFFGRGRGRPPVHFGDLELWGTKKGFPNELLRAVVVLVHALLLENVECLAKPGNQQKDTIKQKFDYLKNVMFSKLSGNRAWRRHIDDLSHERNEL